MTSLEGFQELKVNRDYKKRGIDRKWHNKFDVGPYNNFLQVFGTNPALWFIPVVTTLGDGCHFPVNEVVVDNTTVTEPRPRKENNDNHANHTNNGTSNNPAFDVEIDEEYIPGVVSGSYVDSDTDTVLEELETSHKHTATENPELIESFV
eukprot:CAMPEP_0174265466 /NCGR_PEP_ID=MMETSP0439-20130205/26623_1 /TAXON_ID=0 /ORGANISM="Stereomyxa ramosa, Strain Chinc5" /LENGTH=149 /DNA_ID=CAMNT_0015351933 /DNA_START=648 /DNA_END=1097 /DNA_ORIENTATION=-